MREAISKILTIAGLPLFIVVTLTPLFGPTLYSKWIHGWGSGCDTSYIHDELSPSKKWIARRQTVGCSVLAGGISTDIVLIHVSHLFPFLMREHEVFTLDAVDQNEIKLEIHWMDDRNLEVVEKTCILSDYAVTMDNQVKKTAVPCSDKGKIVTPVEGINVSLIWL